MNMNLKLLEGEKGFEDFCSIVGIYGVEKEARQKVINESFMPFKVTEYYAGLISSQPEQYKMQMINIVIPPPSEKKFTGRFDPYGNVTYRQKSNHFLQHKYEKTLLLHIDDFCISNCQFCYKVNEIRHEDKERIPYDQKIETALGYLDDHQEIDNVLFSGGDPAAFRSTTDLKKLIGMLIDHKNVRVVRFATKGLAYYPERFLDKELLRFFSEVNSRKGKQISVIAQINHPGEMSDSSIVALNALKNAGVQVRGQPAIIKGVNDTVDTLIDLQRRYMDNQIVSYYLTVFMPVRGVEQYGLPLDEAFRNIAESKRHLSGLEKKGVVLTSHDFGKFEICGFYPTPENPTKIILKWHEAAMPKYLPAELMQMLPSRPEDIIILDYRKGETYCIDHLFKYNGLPYFDSSSRLINPKNNR
jgi:KamA family protein